MQFLKFSSKVQESFTSRLAKTTISPLMVESLPINSILKLRLKVIQQNLPKLPFQFNLNNFFSQDFLYTIVGKEERWWKEIATKKKKDNRNKLGFGYPNLRREEKLWNEIATEKEGDERKKDNWKISQKKRKRQLKNRKKTEG